MKIEYVYAIVLLHFLFDWLLQPQKIAENKSKEPALLHLHIWLNIVPYLVLTGLLTGVIVPWKIMINLFSHAVIDWNIYKIHRYHCQRTGLTEREGFSLLFKYIAIDQMLHLAINIWTFS